MSYPEPRPRWGHTPARVAAPATYPRAAGAPAPRPVGAPAAGPPTTSMGAAGAAAAPPVVTLLTVDERLRVDAVGHGRWHALHRESVDDLARELRARPLAALLVSPAALARDGARSAAQGAARLGTLLRAHAGLPAVALLSEVDALTPALALALGQAGVRTLVDVRRPDGWRALRDALTPTPAATLARDAATLLADDLTDAAPGCRRFLDALFTHAPQVATVRVLAARLGVPPTTLMSRFWRARLPSPKRYLAMARLACAARLLEARGRSLGWVADELGYSSAQGFARHVRMLLGMGPRDFRRAYDGEAMLLRFRAELVVPHREALARLEPLG